MQLKCKACNKRLTFYDYSLKTEDCKEEDLCSVCRDIVYLSESDDLTVKEYSHEYLTENWKNFTVYDENA